MTTTTSLPKLILKPRVVSHAVDLPNGVISTKLPGGLSRTRVDILGGPSYVPVTWVLDSKKKFDYLMGFYISILKEGALPFLINMPVLSSECKWVECRFIPRSFKHTSSDGVLRSISAKVEVLDKRGTAEDDAFISLVSATGSFDEADHLELLNMFDRLINGVPYGSDAVTETFPEHMVIK